MTISDLRGFLDKVPAEMDDMQIIYRRFEDEGDNVILHDYPLNALYLDEANNEAVLLDEENWQYFQKNLLEGGE